MSLFDKVNKLSNDHVTNPKPTGIRWCYLCPAYLDYLDEGSRVRVQTPRLHVGASVPGRASGSEPPSPERCKTERPNGASNMYRQCVDRKRRHTSRPEPGVCSGQVPPGLRRRQARRAGADAGPQRAVASHTRAVRSVFYPGDAGDAGPLRANLDVIMCLCVESTTMIYALRHT